MKEIDEAIKDKHSTPSLKVRERRLGKALEKLDEKYKSAKDEIYFDELGVTRLFVDEAHNYKNLGVELSTRGNVSHSSSKKCEAMLDKVRVVQRQNDGGGVIFATGTPITNSITDAFVMQKYLQDGELRVLELNSFSSWVGMFAEQTTDFEIDVDTTNYRMVTRYSKFHNLPELTSIMSSIADFHYASDADGLPQVDGYTDDIVRRTPEFEEYLKNISKRADDVRHRVVSMKEDNMLKITTDGRRAALDIRLVDESCGFRTESKVFHCAGNVAEIYHAHKADKSTQLVFCDISTPKAEFNIYDELRRILVKMGIPDTEIAYIHSATTEAARNKLFAKVRNGDVRVLIGSTFKLGLGVNVQDRLIAVHHLDVPWRPADMTQREGRILRQGNMHDKVQIFRYITKGSFDAYSWQLLETKARFIAELLSGSLSEREGGDIDDTVLNYAEVKAIAIGNPLIKRRVELTNDLSRYKSIHKKTVEEKLSYEAELVGIDPKIEKLKAKLVGYRKDADYYKEYKLAHPETEGRDKDRETKQLEQDERRYMRETLDESIKIALDAHEDAAKEDKQIFDYKGFGVFIPRHMPVDKPFVYLVREERYKVSMGSSEVGNLIRIENFLNDLDKLIVQTESRIKELKDRKLTITKLLAEKDVYVDMINECQQEIKSIDAQLGVA